MASVASATAASAAAVAFVAAHSVASAAVVSWNQPAGGSWSGLNWTGGAGANAPAANDTAAFNLAGAYSVNLNVSPSVAGVQVGGSNVTFTNATAGRTFNNSGALTVSSGAFTLNATNPVNWANGGTITFNANAAVSKGNDLSAPSLAVGSGGNGNPVATFTGAGTSLTLAGGIGVGNGGNGTLNFSTFATATAAGAIDIATSGTTGSGVLIVQNGATLSSQGIRLGTDTATTLGRTAGIHVAGIGAALTNTGAVDVGGGSIGSGSIFVTSGGVFTTAGGAVTVSKAGLIDVQGGAFNADADLMIDGGELNVVLTGTLNLGAGRAMTVQNGAYASIAGGYTLPASSSLTVTGANSKFIQGTLGSVNVSNGSTLNIGPEASVTTLTETIGHDSDGSATQTGGTHTIAGTSAQLVLGTGPGVTGTYNFAGGNLNVTNSWANTIAVMIGGNGTGNFVQTGGVHIVDGTHGSLVIGYGQTGVGTYSVTNGTVGCDTLDIGLLSGSKGTLTVNAGAFVRALTGPVRLAASPGATATATINAGGFMDGTSIYVGGGATEAGGAGVLNVAGGTVATAGEVRVWNTAGSAINLSGGGLSAASVDTSGNPSRFNWTGGNLFITGAAGLDVSAAGPVGSVVAVGPGKSLFVDNRLHIAAGASVACVDGGTVFAGSLSGAGALSANVSFLFIGGDQTSSTFTGTITGGGGGISKGGAGTLTVASTRIAKLAIHQGSIAVIPTGGLPNATSTVTDLTIDEGAKLDLGDNKLIVDAGDVGTFDGMKYTGVTGQIASAYNFGNWDGTGIKTSMPDAQADRGITTLAVATADDVFYAGGTFGGVPVSSGDVLIMYTYAGDLNLDGRIDGADYGVIDNSIQFPGTAGYANGDINFDGVIDGADYGAIDNSIQLQGEPFPSGTYGASDPAAVTAVPEPGALALAVLLVPAASLARRRRRRRQGAQVHTRP